MAYIILVLVSMTLTLTLKAIERLVLLVNLYIHTEYRQNARPDITEMVDWALKTNYLPTDRMQNLYCL